MNFIIIYYYLFNLLNNNYNLFKDIDNIIKCILLVMLFWILFYLYE